MTTARSIVRATPRALALLGLAASLAACTEDPKGGGADGEVVDDSGGDEGSDGADGSDGGDGGDGSDGTEPDPVPTTLELTVDNPTPAVGERVQLTVTIFDETGATMTGVPVDIGIAPEEGTDYAAGLLTIEAEGIYTVTASVADTSLTDSVTVTADGAGPWIQLDSPARGLWHATDTDVTVSGQVVDPISPVTALMLNGSPVELDADGRFSTTFSPPDGAHRLTLEAEDGAGNRSDLILGGMAGETVDPDDGLNNGILAHLGQGGLDAFGGLMLDAFTPEVVEAAVLANNPLVTGSLSGVSYTVRGTDFTFDNPVVTVTPESGNLNVVLEFDDMDLGLSGSGSLFGNSSSFNGSLTDSHVEVSMDIGFQVLYPGLPNGFVTDTEVTFTDLQVNVGSLSALLSTLGLSVSDLGIDFEGLVAAEVEGIIPDAVDPELRAAVRQIEVNQAFDLLGSTLDLEGLVSGIDMETDGMLLKMLVLTDGPAAHPDAPELAGVLDLADDTPSWSLAQDAELALRADTINNLLHRATVAGALNLEVSGGDLGLEPEVIDSLFPGASTLELSFSPMLPPVVQPGESESGMVLVVPALQVEAWGEVDGTLQQLTLASVQVEAGVALTSEDSSVGLEFIDLEAAVDVAVTEASQVGAAEELEETLQGVATGLVGDLLPALTLDMPPVGDLTLTPTGGAAGGAAQTWMVITAYVD